MNIKLLRTGVITLGLFAVSFTGNAQKLKTEPDPRTIKKDQVYKNQKMFDSKTGAKNTKTPIERQADNAIERYNYELNRLKNPYTNEIPKGIRSAEVTFSSKIGLGELSKKALSNSSVSAKSASYYNWKNRGPFNVGGRTRALAIDRTNENVILAGGVSGGLWRSENSGATWDKVTRNYQSPSITTIIQDPRPSNSYTWYYASGERIGNSASSGSFYTGSGVYKSQDGGRTFELLNATADGTVTSISPFDIVNSIAVNPINGDLYVATFNGLHRSQDGGNSFTEVLAGGFDNRVEVNIASTGQIYATIEYDGIPNAGFFTSFDGDNWINITPTNFIPFFGRTIVGIDPSNEDTVYFFSHNLNGNSQLNRYDASNGTWVDLSANLPFSIGGSVGDLNLQTGYNMVIKVHPADSNIVFVGGTNLYRSTDGFTSLVGQEGWIAGYSPLNNVSLYSNQHPDQHELVFYPSNPNKVLSGNDGGVYLAEDITEDTGTVEPVTWTSLNNGYITTQPYHVAFDPEPNTDDLVAGFQDNGTWFTNSTDSDAIWEEDFGGDGTYSAIADGGRTRYVSSQNGNVYRFNFDENGNFSSFSRVRPAGASDFSFVNPYILDSNNDNIMYMPIGTNIWRNSNLDEIPIFSNANATENWTNLTNSQTNDGSTITALNVSKYPVANTLYYGTNSGQVYKMVNANIDSQVVVELTEGKGLPSGYVNDINIDASNNDRVIVSYSNYGIQSIFLTEDGGETWTNISGNLEENPDGSGNGPSVRATAFLGSKGENGSRAQIIYTATSTGLYSTDYLNGQNTVWRREDNTIGNAVIDEVATRKDGFVAVAAHGNGLFSARFPITRNPLPESSLSVAFLLDDLDLALNSEDTVIDITGLFVQSGDLPISIEVTNSNPALATVTLDGNNLTVSYEPDASGDVTIGLIATSNGEQVAEGFTVTIAEPAIYEQLNAAISSVPSQSFPDFGGFLAQAADDFYIPSGNTWMIDRVKAFGGASGAPEFTNASVVIFRDSGGVPGEEIYNSGEIVPISETNDSNIELMLPEVLTLESGDYWISIYVNLAFFPDFSQWFWTSESNNVGEVTHFRDVEDLFGTGAIDWTSTEVALGTASIDQTFQIFGDIISVSNSENVQQEAALATLDSNTEITALAWPNPSNNVFHFNMNSITSDTDLSIQIFDISGKLVHKKLSLDTDSVYTWDASSMATGIYFVNLDGENISKRFKILKK